MNISTLICHRDVDMAIQCLGSLARNVSGTRLVLHDDGTLTVEDIAKLAQALPVETVIDRRHADEAVGARLGNYPACRRARSRNIYMLKLFDVALLRGDDDIRYCDTDILFFRRIHGLFDAPPGMLAVFLHDRTHAYSVRPWHLWPGSELRLPQYLNGGMFVFSRARFDLDYVEWLLSQDSLKGIFAHIPVWAEQTCWAALAFRAGCGLWDPERIALVDEGWALHDRTVAAHFVSPARARLGSALEQGARLNSSGDVASPVAVLKARECTAFTLAKSQLLRRLRRAGVRL